jgi:hypothetical protein
VHLIDRMLFANSMFDFARSVLFVNNSIGILTRSHRKPNIDIRTFKVIGYYLEYQLLLGNKREEGDYCEAE